MAFGCSSITFVTFCFQSFAGVRPLGGGGIADGGPRTADLGRRTSVLRYVACLSRHPAARLKARLKARPFKTCNLRFQDSRVESGLLQTGPLESCPARIMD